MRSYGELWGAMGSETTFSRKARPPCSHSAPCAFRLALCQSRMFQGFQVRAARREAAASLFKRRTIKLDFVNGPFISDQIKLALVIPAKRHNPFGRQANLANFVQPAVLPSQPPDAARLVIAKHIHTIKGRFGIGPIDKAARDRDSKLPAVRKYRHDI